MGILDIFRKKNDDEKDACTSENSSDNAVENKLLSVLKEIQDTIQKATVTPVVRMKIKNGCPGIFESKIGGTAYLPHDDEIPLDDDGFQMKMLSQIDCSKLESLNNFPHSGLLQFWTSTDDQNGLDINEMTKQDNFRVIYYSEIDLTVTEDECLKKIKEGRVHDFFPVSGEYAVELIPANEGMTSEDFRYNNLFAMECRKKLADENYKSVFDIDSEIYEKLYSNLDNNFGHKVGGYPSFTQDDPRNLKNEYSQYDTLLLQIDSDFDSNETRIMWGDSGVCNFFINHEALERCDFSEVLYSWDCY